VTRARYDRLAPLYDVLEWLPERTRFGRWRARLWRQVAPGRLLEVGVGTGKNIHYYPPGATVTAVDISPKMLTRAAKRAARVGREVHLLRMDTQALEFPDAAFDAAAATFVFCSVPDPVSGLRELRRVVRLGGRIYLLEHMRADHPVLGRIMDWLDPIVVRLLGPHINRRTVDNVAAAGLEIEAIEDLAAFGMVRLITARVP
jgi:ubiquinone/menaquinone biosynthesis C-methylase UbiE